MKHFTSAVVAVLTGSLLGTAHALPSKEGLIAEYFLDGNALDASGNGHSGEMHGTTATFDRYGNENGALSFDGNSWVSIPDSPAFTLGASDFTMSLWVALDRTSGEHYVMGHDDGGGPNNKWIFRLRPDTSTFLLHVNTPQPGTAVNLGVAWGADTQWHHLAITREGDLFKFFQDGKLLGSATNSVELPDPEAPLLLGSAEDTNPERLLVGRLDDVSIYARALSDNEIGQLAAIPEPSSLALLCCGLLLMGTVTVRRRQWEAAVLPQDIRQSNAISSWCHHR